jgi:hypothetical protein
MLSITPPFDCVSSHHMWESLAPASIPIAFCAASPGGEYLLACGFIENLVVAQFDNQDRPSLRAVKLPDFFVQGVTCTHDPVIFVFLVSTRRSTQYLLHFDIQSFQEVQRVRLSSPMTGIGSAFDAEGYSTVIAFGNRTALVQETEIPVPQPVHSWFSAGLGEIFLQLLDGSIHGLADGGLIPKGRLPLITIFCPVNGSLLFCVAAYGDSFFLPMSFTTKIDLNEAFDFNLLPKSAITLTPCITCAMFRDRCLFVGSSGGEDSQYIVSSYVNTLPFLMSKARDLTVGSESVELFCLPHTSLIVSTDSETIQIKGDLNICKNRTLAIGPFDNDFAQVHEHGIRKILSGRDFASDSRIKYGAVSRRNCVAAFDDKTVRVFDVNLEIVKTTTLPSAHAFAFCSDLGLAIAAERAGGGNPTVTLYSLDLIPSDDVCQLTSRAFALLFMPLTMDLFISMENGAVSRWALDSRICTQVFVSERPCRLFLFMDFVVFSGQKTLVFNGTDLLNVLIEDPRALCPGDEVNELFVYDRTNSILVAEILETEKDLKPTTISLETMPRKLAKLPSSTCVITRQKKGHGFISNLVTLDDALNIQSLSEFPPTLGAISMVAHGDFLSIGFITQQNTGVLSIFRQGDDNTFSLVRTFEFDHPPLALAVYSGQTLLVGFGRYYKVIKIKAPDEMEMADRKFGPVPTQIAFIECTENFIWVGDRVESVYVYKVNGREGPVAVDTECRNLTALGIVRDDTAAVGERSGRITLLRIPLDMCKHNGWRMSPVPDRGIRQPYGDVAGHLIRLAVFSVDEAVTSLLMRGSILYYTTLLGQIGAFIPLELEGVEFGNLANAELMVWKGCSSEFGVTQLRKFGVEKVNVIDGDVFEFMERLAAGKRKAIEEFSKLKTDQITGMLCRIKHLASF